MELLKEQVRKILEEKPTTRSDDFLLVKEVIKKHTPTFVSVEYVLTNHVELGIPSFASIVRVRRLLQASDDSLAPTKNVAEARSNKQQEILEMVRES